MTREYFTDVVLINEPTSQQMFVAKLPLIKQYAQHLDRAYVHLDPGFPIRYTPPDEVIDALNGITYGNSSNLSLPEGLSTRTAVAIAGILLDYAVVYVPPFVPTTLSNISMHFYECTLRYNDNSSSGAIKTHTIMKFSCPSDDIKQSDIVNWLNSLFSTRLSSINDPNLLEVTVQHEELFVKHGLTY